MRVNNAQSQVALARSASKGFSGNPCLRCGLIKRHGFSLLEMLLALAIGLVLLTALYFFLNMNILQTQAGRDVLAEGALVRSIMLRLNADISSQLGPVDNRVNNYLQCGVPSSMPNIPVTPAASSSSSSGGSGGSGGASAAATTPALPITSYNMGIYGQPTYIILSNYRVKKPDPNQPTNVPDLVPTSDARRTIYWLVSNGPGASGLARMDVPQATSFDVDVIDPTTFTTDPTSNIFAPEVKDILFEYYDGVMWQPQWDGTNTLDGTVPPSGPPLAIRITITLRATAGPAADDPNADGPKYQQIIAIPATNSFTPNTNS